MVLALPRIKPAPPEQIPLHDVLRTLPTEELNRLVRYRLGLDPETVYSARDTKDIWVDRLLEKVDSDDRWGEFLLMVCAEKPKPLFLNVCSVLARLPPPEWERCVRCRLLMEALRVGFNLAVLEGVVNKLSRKLPPDLPREPLEALAQGLAEWADRENWTRDLVREGFRVFPGHPALKKFGENYFAQDLAGWLAVDPEADQSAADSAQRAVQTIQGLCQAQPQVRATIQGFQPRLQAITTQSRRLSNLKTLHDGLHQLVSEYPPKIRLLIENADRADCRQELNELRLRLRYEFLPRFQDFKDNDRVPGLPLEWIAELAAVEKSWRAAMNDLKDKKAELQEVLDDVQDTLERVVQRELFKVNLRMVDGAREYKIGELLEVLTGIQEALQAGALSAQALEEVHAGFQDLTNLNIKLQGMIEQHDQWQTLDHELQNLALDNLRQVKKNWERLAKNSQAIFLLAPPEWLEEFEPQLALIDSALKASNLAGVEEPFRTIKTLVHSRFLLVDRDLKNYFGPLSSAVNSLSSLLRV